MWFCNVWLAPEIDFAALVVCNLASEGAPALCDKAIGELIRSFAPKSNGA